jgi:Zn-dependent protease
VIFGLPYFDEKLEYGLLWVACMFLSVLVHEFGHITMGRIFGRPGSVLLYSFGGLAIGDYELPRRSQRIAVSLAGPGAGLLLYGLIVAVERVALPQLGAGVLGGNPIIGIGVYMLLWMNLIWNVLNLIPIWPLDGGHVSREVFSAVSPGNGFRLALQFSMLLAAAGAIYSLVVWSERAGRLPYPPISAGFAALLLGLMAVENYQMLQHTRRNRWDY